MPVIINTDLIITTSVRGILLRVRGGGDGASQSTSSLPESDSSLSDDGRALTPKSLTSSAVGLIA
jgi:hypothetical protein